MGGSRLFNGETLLPPLFSFLGPARTLLPSRLCPVAAQLSSSAAGFKDMAIPDWSIVSSIHVGPWWRHHGRSPCLLLWSTISGNFQRCSAFERVSRDSSAH